MNSYADCYGFFTTGVVEVGELHKSFGIFSGLRRKNNCVSGAVPHVYLILPGLFVSIYDMDILLHLECCL